MSTLAGERRVIVAQAFADHLRVLAVRQQVGGVAVPQVVEPDARQLGLLRHRAEVAGHDVAQVHRLPVRLAKHQSRGRCTHRPSRV